MDRARNILQHVIQDLNEIAPKRKGRIRNRQYKVAFVCPPFYRRVNTSCIQDTPQQARKISKMHKRIWRRVMRKNLRQLLLRRKLSLARRRAVFGAPHVASSTSVHPPNEFLAVVKMAGRMSQTLKKGRGAGRGLTARVSIPTTTPISQGLSSLSSGKGK